MGAIQTEPMSHLQNRIEELNPMASLPSIAIDRYITAQYRHLSMINAPAISAFDHGHVGRQRIHPLACISLHMTVPEPQALEAGTVRAKRARAAGMSPAARALRSDVVRRAASRGGTLRCAEARRVAYHDVDKSYASHRPD